MTAIIHPELIFHEDCDASINFDTLVANFGDGAEQTAPNGINSERQEWQITWRALNTTQMQEVIDFFRTVKGTTSFTWTAFGETTEMKWKLKDNSLRKSIIYFDPNNADRRKWSVSCTIRRVYQ